MLPRVAPLSQILLRNARTNVRTAYHEAGWRHPKEIAVTTRATINDIPVPQGSWKEGFDKRNKTWNMYFAAGLVTLSVTLYVCYERGCFYLHGPPDYKKLKPNVPPWP